MPRTTPLLSSKAPVVNPGEISLPVLTAVGEWAHLSATPTQWRAIVSDLAAALGLEIRPAKSHGVRISPELKPFVRKPGGHPL